MILLIDNYDSFSYMLCDYILQAGGECTVIKNDEKSIDEIIAMQPKAIVLSPGPKTPDEAGVTLQVVAAFHHKIPLLGICLGHQAIGQFFGAAVKRASTPVHGYTSDISVNNQTILFENLPATIAVMRYHSLIVSELPDTLQTIAQTATGEIMAIQHQSLPIFGIQFHPESALTDFGIEIIKNWVDSLDIIAVD